MPTGRIMIAEDERRGRARPAHAGNGGEDVLSELCRVRADLPVLLVSGYAGNETELPHGPHVDFLAKPFTADELLGRLQALRRTGG